MDDDVEVDFEVVEADHGWVVEEVVVVGWLELELDLDEVEVEVEVEVDFELEVVVHA